MKEMQKDVDKWTSQFTPQYWPPLEMMARLSEEVGEVAREINHLHGTKKRKPGEAEGNLGQEFTDVIFTICCMANSAGIDLENEWKTMMEKKHYGRDQNRWKAKDETKVN